MPGSFEVANAVEHKEQSSPPLPLLSFEVAVGDVDEGRASSGPLRSLPLPERFEVADADEHKEQPPPPPPQPTQKVEVADGDIEVGKALRS